MQLAPKTPSLFAEELGAGPRVIVLLHGFGASHDVWRPIAEALAAENRTIAYDLPGHGKSLDWPEAGPAKTAVRAVLADLDRRGIDKVHFVGHSMGGAVAALTALSRPDRVASLTLLAPGGFGEEINGPLLRRYAAATSEVELRHCLTAMSGPGFAPSDATVDALAAMRAVTGQTKQLLYIAAVIAAGERQGVIPRDKLGALSMPVAALWGTQDPVLPFTQTADLPPAFTLYPLRNAGHMLAEERPDLVVNVIRRTAR